MIPKFCAVSLSLLSFQFALAQSATSAPVPKNSKTSAQAKTATQLTEPTNTFDLALTHSLYSIWVENRTGVEFGYIMSRRFTFFVDTMYSQKTTGSKDARDWYKASELLASASARFSPSRGSFNLVLGLGYRNYSAEGMSLGGQIYPLKVQALVLNFAIGNRWQIGRFVIGADWLGAQYNISTLSKTSLPDDGLGLNGLADAAITSLPTAEIVKLVLGFRI